MILVSGRYPRRGLLIDLQYCAELAPADRAKVMAEDKENAAQYAWMKIKGKTVESAKEKGVRTVSISLLLSASTFH